MINKRSELMNKCLHKGKYLLDKISTASKKVGKKDNTEKILDPNGKELKKSGAASLNQNNKSQHITTMRPLISPLKLQMGITGVA